MLKALIRVRLASFFAGMARNLSKGKKRSAVPIAGVALLLVFLLACFAFLFFSEFLVLALSLPQMRLSWLYFAYAGIAAMGLSIIGSVFSTQSQLYEARDNELLLSMPVKPSMILASRMAVLMLINLVLTMVVLGSAGAAYLYAVGQASARGVVCFIIAGFALPFLTQAVTSLFAALLHVISMRMRKKALWQSVLSIAFLLAYIFVITKMESYLTALIQNSQQIAQSISAFVFPMYHFGQAAMGNAGSLFWFLLCAAAPFALVYAVLSRTFVRLATATQRSKKIRYVARKTACRSPLRAMIGKEYARLFSSSAYLLNAGIGLVMMVICAVFLFLYRGSVAAFLPLLPGVQAYLPLIAVAAMAFLVTMCTISASSVSLEGKSLAILQAMPVAPQIILSAKVLAHLMLSLPLTILSGILMACALPMDPLARVHTVLTPALFCVLFGLAGVVINLRFPKLDALSIHAVVKSGASVTIAIFGGWGVVIVLALVYVLLRRIMTGQDYLLLCDLLIALGIGACVRYLLHGGVKHFEALNV